MSGRGGWLLGRWGGRDDGGFDCSVMMYEESRSWICEHKWNCWIL